MSATPLIEQLAEFVAATPTEVDASVVDTIRDSVIDTYGCILVGAAEEVALLSRKALSENAPGTAQVYGSAMRARPESAAFLNAVAGHALDMDDWEIPGNSHASVVHGRVQRAHFWSRSPESIAAMANANATENPT